MCIEHSLAVLTTTSRDYHEYLLFVVDFNK